ncbi:uncharacterized protein LOC133771071 [Lepus europaeus]|uniref:uncharacterized protein LOC133771071 n=1 Tax=Lepus europaeus TaxID=9983 RepID=UPI002B4A3D1A|nr:uncharacterized protein LOC133771071 [Lepus europaeus]
MDHLRHRDFQGRFQFEQYTALQAFKFRRVQSLILDLKYVLISKPTEWSDELRQKFLEGFDAFLELLKCMQGMDPITRQVGQHIEMEPEWEAAFTLQMKLTHVISMMQDWCALDVSFFWAFVDIQWKLSDTVFRKKKLAFTCRFLDYLQKPSPGRCPSFNTEGSRISFLLRNVPETRSQAFGCTPTGTVAHEECSLVASWATTMAAHLSVTCCVQTSPVRCVTEQQPRSSSCCSRGPCKMLLPLSVFHHPLIL